MLVVTAAPATSATHQYTVTIDDSMRTLSVEARFSRPVTTVTARSRSASRYLDDVRGCSEDPEIRMRNRRMMLPEGGVQCLSYTVDLQRIATEYRNNRNLARQNIVASPSYWMWRPELHDDTTIDVDFRLPENVRVSVPWKQLNESATRYRVGQSPESAHAPAIFGDFDYREIEVPGATLRVALLQTDLSMNNDEIMDWVRATATDVSLGLRLFPESVAASPGHSGLQQPVVKPGALRPRRSRRRRDRRIVRQSGRASIGIYGRLDRNARIQSPDAPVPAQRIPVDHRGACAVLSRIFC